MNPVFSIIHILVLAICLCPIIQGQFPSPPSPSLDERFKQDLVISQFRKKLVEYLTKFNSESVLIGASHGRKKNKSPKRHLKNVQGISILRDDQQSRISKIIFPGFKVDNVTSDESEWFQFRLPKYLSRGSVKYAKLFIYAESLGPNIRGWQISVANSSRVISKYYRNLSKAKMQQFLIADILKAFLDDFHSEIERPPLVLRLTKLAGLNTAHGVTKIKNILLMISVKDGATRQRRSVIPSQENTCNSSTLYCCMRSFSVTPMELNLQNLINPDVIQLNYCSGECNHYMKVRSNYANALAQLKRSKISPLSVRQLESMTSCCTPRSYSTILITYRDYHSQQLVVVDAKDMVVSSCGCL